MDTKDRNIKWYGSSSKETDVGIELFEKGYTFIDIFHGNDTEFAACVQYVHNNTKLKWRKIGTETSRKMAFISENDNMVQLIADRVLHNLGIDPTSKDSPYLWKPSILTSLPGCGSQPFHLDNEIDDFSDFNILYYPFNAILAIDDHTFIDVLEDDSGNIVGCTNESKTYTLLRKMVLQNRRKELHIPKGYAFIFRGDFIHAGSQFHTINNRRMHLYFINKYEMCFRENYEEKYHPTTYWLDGR